MNRLGYALMFILILFVFPNAVFAADNTENDEATLVSTAQQTLTGLALKEYVHVYETTDRESTAVKSYHYGHVLKYRTYTDTWYKATIFIHGERKAGYIHHDDVGNRDEAKSIRGVALKQKTAVYQNQSRKSAVLKEYEQSHILKYRAYDTDWFIATVFNKGKAMTGYIHKQDVGPINTPISGYAQKDVTAVYSDMSRNSKQLRKYDIGSTLKYRAHNKNWHEATVILGGKVVKGYIHVNDVKSNKPILRGYGMKSSTRVYKKKSRNASILKTYQKGSSLIYKPYNKDWFEATVIQSGKRVKGYIHKNDVSNKKPKLGNVDKLTSIHKNDQVILVTAKGNKTSKAKIQTFERDATGNLKHVLSTTGYIGKNGFTTNKKEGDGKSPVGKYSIGTAFGQQGNPGTKLPFKSITNDDVWVDDPKSSLYNSWQSRSKTSGQWRSAENMNHRLYTHGFVINYNTKRTPYKGSAIFFHVATSYTVGCTGTDRTNVISILKWIDPKKNPVIIQTPEKDLTKY